MRIGIRVPARWRIASLLTLSMVFVVALFICVITVLDIRRTQAIFWSQLEQRGLFLASQMNGLLADSLYFLDLESLDKTSTIISSQPGIEYLRVYTPEGRLLIDTGSPVFPVGVFVDDFGMGAIQSRQSMVRRNGPVLEISSPISAGNQVLGGVWIGMGSDELQAQVRGIIIEHIWQGAVLVLLAVGVSYVVSQRLTRPVRELVSATERIASGELEARATTSRGGEMEELASSFNRMADELQSRLRELQVSRSRIVTVQENVRREIASHLHGRVQGRLLILKNRLEEMASENHLDPQESESVRDIAGQLATISQEDLSGLSRRLYPSILRRGLVPAIQSLADHFEQTFAVDLELDDDLMRQERQNRNLIPEHVRLAGYRIAEEALTNTVKHAGATRVVIRLGRTGGELHLSVEDDGQGFDVEAASGGMGTTAVLDYAQAVGGQSAIRSAPGSGTKVIASLPLAGLDTESLSKSSPSE